MKYAFIPVALIMLFACTRERLYIDENYLSSQQQQELDSLLVEIIKQVPYSLGSDPDDFLSELYLQLRKGRAVTMPCYIKDIPAEPLIRIPYTECNEHQKKFIEKELRKNGDNIQRYLKRLEENDYDD